ncbi:hypothetical protein C1645_742664 [Glomus cerebriforme]|uniref:Uncharacterized protein n=1 Tax=Glomus cerebriforme TaxID=658196 RepID=A0A397SIK2_9GLOM|nr:hypothetical protein C1645_742664 [Glomus cerebriforme]
MKEEFITNYYYNKELKYIIEGRMDRVLIKQKRDNEREKNIQIDELEKQKSKINKREEEEQNILGEIKTEKWGIKILTRQFNAYWKNNIIDYNIRKVMKDINQLKNKAEWIVQSRNKELRMNIDKDEIDWNKTFNFIMLKNEELTFEMMTKNMKKRSYRIKNFLEELHTLELINKRNNNLDDIKCMRCKVDNENWNHIWKCENNSTTLYEIVQENLQKNIENLKKKNIYVNEARWKDRIINILLEKSTTKVNQLIIMNV